MQSSTAAAANGGTADAAGDQPEVNNVDKELLPEASKTTKPKRRCLRLDCHHIRNVFSTTFYRIWMYRRRHLMITLLQLLIPPIILIGMTAYLGTLLEMKEKLPTHYEPLNEQELQNKICGSACSTTGGRGLIAYYMANKRTEFAKHFSEELEKRLLAVNIETKMVDKKEDLIRTAVQYQLKGEQDKFIAGIEIDNPVLMAHKIPGFMFDPTPVFFDLNRNNPKFYYQLLGIELAVCRTFYQLVKTEQGSTAQEEPLSIDIKSLSYPGHKAYTLKSQYDTTEDELKIDLDEYEGIDSMLATIFVLSMVPVFFTVVEGPVTEKENGFKLYLQLMGFPRGAYWFHWILNQMIVQVFVIIMQVSLIFEEFDKNTGKLVRYGDPTLWVLVLILYNFSCLSFFAFFAAFGRRAKMTTYLGILIWLLTYHLLQSHVFDFSSSFSLFMVSCLIPSGCIHWAVYIFTTATSITWEISVNFSLTQNSGFNLADVMAMMILNFFVYFLLTLYVDNLNPGPLELGQPWNYFFESIRCRFIDPNKEVLDKTPVPSGADVRGKNINHHRHRSSRCPPNVPVIEFKRISKKFYLIDGVYGIENVQFSVYPEGVTVLLGHKDSGRTTLMRLLCGAYAPTSGTVMVFDYNVRKNTQKVQSFLNVCMEENLLCHYLTVMEHMQLISKLKGVSGKAGKDECKSILEHVGLLAQQNDSMWKLAKWQRRVLCVAMALVGDAPILVLDEPTASLDLDAKRQIWALLKELKAGGKTILMSTQDVGEAYEVADRIVLMARGRLAGVGPPSKLENLFETGYHLTVSTIPNANTEEILAFLKKHIPTVREREGGLKQVRKAIQVENWDRHSQTAMRSIRSKLSKSKTVVNIPAGLNDTSSTVTDKNRSASHTKPDPTYTKEPSLVDIEISYLLPAAEREKFPSLFTALDVAENALKIGIKDYDLTWHSIENAFDEIDDCVDVLEAARHSTDDTQFEDFVESTTKALRFLTQEPSHEPMPVFTRERTCWRGLWAIIIKRLCHLAENYRQVFLQLMVPILILLVTLSSINDHFNDELLSSEIKYNASMELTSPQVPFRIKSNDQKAIKFLESFKSVTRRPPNYIHKFKDIGTSEFYDIYAEDRWHKLHDEVLIAADFTQVEDGKKVTALFSPGHLHSSPLSLLLMFNSLIEYEFPDKSFSIGMTGRSMLHGRQYSNLMNSTFPKTIIASGVDITLTVSLAFGYFIFASGFVTQPCSERLCKLKRYQMYNLDWNGLYWIGSTMVDSFLNIVLIILLTLVIYYAPSHEVFKNPQFIILFVIAGTLGGLSLTIASYYWSHYWIKKSTSFYATLSVNQFFGLFLFLFYTIINFDFFGDYLGAVVAFCLQVIQPFTIPWNFHVAILWALQNGKCRTLNPLVKEELCSEKSKIMEIKNAQKECCFDKPKEWSLGFICNHEKGLTVTPLWSNVAFLCFHCVAGILFLMYMESRRRRRKLLHILSKPEKPPVLINLNDAKSIKNEEMLVREELPQLDETERQKWFIVDNLSTSIDNRTLLHPMTFAIEAGKCTVVVGPETCGITILYEILAGLRAISEGDVSYGGLSLFSWGSRRAFLQKLGLSPSQDVSLDKLTGKQLLSLFGRLRGIPPKQLANHITYWVERLGLQRKIKKQCVSYSVVMKRKLSIACAAIGNPSVFIFEEPTKDLDPVSKSEVCKVINSLICANRVVLILTHDLASVKNLCSKLIILVNGQMQFCETTENIYEEIGEEFTLTIKLKGDERGKIDFKAFANFVTEIENEIDSMTLQEEQSHLLMYRIKDIKHNWSSLFETVEKVVKKHESIVLDYNIRKTSLEDVYNSYAVKQRHFRIEDSVWEEFRTTYC